MRYMTYKPIIPEAFFLVKPPPSCGALSTFFGIVRNHHEGRAVRKLYYECYIPMANGQIGLIRESAMRRWELTEASILHRVGWLEVGEIALAVAVASAHRAETFAACEAIVAEIKHRVPIWKKELFENGSAEWVSCAHEKAFA